MDIEQFGRKRNNIVLPDVKCKFIELLCINYLKREYNSLD